MAWCKKYNYLGTNGVVVGKNDVLRGSVWCYSKLLQLLYGLYLLYIKCK